MHAPGSKRRDVSLGFTDELVSEGQHICYLFNDERERRQVVARFLESGLLAGEKVLCLVDAITPEEVLDSLEELGVAARASAPQLTVGAAQAAYCPSGVFDPEAMLGVVGGFYQQAVRDEGYAGARVTGDGSWCLGQDATNLAPFLDYEARVNDLLRTVPITACCQYDTRCFDGEAIMDVLAVHPMMVVRGQVVRNPYYVAPEVFLREYRARSGG